MSATKEGTNVAETIAGHKEAILLKLALIKEFVNDLERAVNDPEIDTRGIGYGWVTNISDPLESIKFRVAQVDALATVKVFK